MKLNTQHTFWSWLIRCVNKKWIQPVLWKMQSYSVHRQTDGWTDGHTKWNQYTPPYTSLGMGYIKAFGIITLIIMNAPVQITDLRGMQ